jgi:DNA adenine methylase
MVKKAKPPLKWVGGKTQLLPELMKRVPAGFGTYFEPFLGGGALFFTLQPKAAYLNDANEELMNLYRVIRDKVEKLIDELGSGDYMNDEETFYAIRSDRRTIDDVLRAARTVYLNKTCFNGLYRVNARGGFNSPFGRYKNPTICDEANLRAVSLALQGAELREGEYSHDVLNFAVPGDFVYFDPPYIPLTKTSSFTAYTPGKFGLPEHIALRDTALQLKESGVHVLLSNSVTRTTWELYADHGFTLDLVEARRSINANGSGRGAIKEYLIY